MAATTAMAPDIEDGRMFTSLVVRCAGASGLISLSELGDFIYTPQPRSSGLFGWLAGFVRPQKVQRIRGHELLGASLDAPGAFTVWYASEYTTRTGCVEKRRFRVRRTPRFQAADPTAASALVEHLRRTHSWWGRAHPPHIAAIVNPVSGRGAARRLLERQLLPLLRDAAGLRVSVHVTAAPMHAAELVRDMTLAAPEGSGKGVGGAASSGGREEAEAAAAGLQSEANADGVDAIMFVGGDGTLYEGLQGLFQRPDWPTARHVPLVPVPCGSGNGLAASAGLWDPDTALAAVCRGRTEQVDVASVLQPPGNRFYCLLSVVYGAMANLDIGTESWRWMGELRFHLGGLREIFRGRAYSCRVFVRPPDGAAASGVGHTAGHTAGAASPREAVVSPSGVDLGAPLLPACSGDGSGLLPAAAVTTGAAAAASLDGPKSAAGGGVAGGGAGHGTGAGSGGIEERLLPAGSGTRGSASRHHGAGEAGSQISDYPAGPPLPLLSQLASLPSPLPDSPASLPPGWRQLPDCFAIFGAYNTQYLALGARPNPGGRMGDGAWEVWQLQPGGEGAAENGGGNGGSSSSGGVGAGRRRRAGAGAGGGGKALSGGVRLRALRVLLGIEDGSFAKAGDVMEVTQARALMFEQRDSATWTVLDGERVPDRPLFLEVHPGLCRLLVSPHFREEGL